MYLPEECTSGSLNSNLPTMGDTWQIDIDTTNGKVLWWNPSDIWNQAWQAEISDFSNMHHIVMVFGGGIFDLNVDNSFLKTRYNPADVSFPTSTSVNVANGATTRIIGEKITLTSVTSYQLKFTIYGASICFGLISSSDITTVLLEGGGFNAHWGVCVGATYKIAVVCPCDACYAGCGTCSGPFPQNCSACLPNLFFNSDSECVGCDTACSVCSGSTPNQCSVCNPGYFLQPASTTCLSTCPDGYYKDTTNNICAACHTACSACTGSSNTECSTCNPGYFLQPPPATTTCINSCPPGYGGDSTTRTCVQCHTYCSICTGSLSTQCSACKPGYFLQPAPAVTTCSSTCPARYWGNTVTRTCMACNDACAVCLDETNSQCTACNSGYFLQPSSTICLNSCPTTGYWQDTTNHRCATCHIYCAICSGAGNAQCSACNSGYFKHPSANMCSNSCPTGYWKDTTNHICAPCDTSCMVCLDGTNTQCTTCKTGYFKQPSSIICLNSCPTGY